MTATLRPMLAALALLVVVGAMSAFARTAAQAPRIVPDAPTPSDGKARLLVIPAERATTTTIVLTGTGRLGSFRFTDALIKATPKT